MIGGGGNAASPPLAYRVYNGPKAFRILDALQQGAGWLVVWVLGNSLPSKARFRMACRRRMAMRPIVRKSCVALCASSAKMTFVIYLDHKQRMYVHIFGRAHGLFPRGIRRTPEPLPAGRRGAPCLKVLAGRFCSPSIAIDLAAYCLILVSRLALRESARTGSDSSSCPPTREPRRVSLAAASNQRGYSGSP